MVYRSSKKAREAAVFRKAIIMTFGAVLILGGASYAYMRLLQTKVQIDPVSMCPVDGPSSITAVLIDSTDPFSGIQKEYLSKYFSELLQSVEKGARIEVYSAIDYSVTGFSPMVSLCNPGSGEDASAWTANPDRIKKKWRQLFDEPLRQTVVEGLTSDGAEQSPIMKMIQSLSIRAFPLNDKNIKRQLVVVSDMLEHTPDFSQYSQTTDFTEVKQMPFFAHVTPNLAKTQVSILYVSRDRLEQLQTRSHAEFWGAYFANFGAVVKVIQRI